MEGIVAEGAEVMDEDFEGALMDASLITAAQRVEHYEIAAYGSVVAFAQLLGETDAASTLQETLTEEKETDAKLTKLSKQINQQANAGSSENEDETDRENDRRGKTARAAGAR